MWYGPGAKTIGALSRRGKGETLLTWVAGRIACAGAAQHDASNRTVQEQRALGITQPQAWGLDWLPVILWAAVIISCSTSYFSENNTSRIIVPVLRWLWPTASAATLALAHAAIRKLAHFVNYAILFWLLARGPMWGRPYAALTLCVLYALSDEGHQLFVPSRTPSLYDVALDSSGALFSHLVRAAIHELT